MSIPSSPERPLYSLFQSIGHEKNCLESAISACLIGTDLLNHKPENARFVNPEHIKGKPFNVVAPGLLSGFLLFNGLSESTQEAIAGGRTAHRLFIYDTAAIVIESGLTALKEAATQSASFSELTHNFHEMFKNAINATSQSIPDKGMNALELLNESLPIRLASVAEAFNSEAYGYEAFRQLLYTTSLDFCDYTDSHSVRAQLEKNKVDIKNTAFMFSNVEVFSSRGNSSTREISAQLEGKCLSITHTNFLPSWNTMAQGCVWMICGENRKDGPYTHAKLKNLQTLGKESKAMRSQMKNLRHPRFTHEQKMETSIDAIRKILNGEIKALKEHGQRLEQLTSVTRGVYTLEADSKATKDAHLDSRNPPKTLKRCKGFLPAATMANKPEGKAAGTSLGRRPEKNKRELSEFEISLKKAGNKMFG